MNKINEYNEILEEPYKDSDLIHIENKPGKFDQIKLNSEKADHDFSSNSDIFILEAILEQFIPYFKEINFFSTKELNSKILDLFHDLIIYTSNGNKLPISHNKNTLFKFKDECFALEGKEFLYKTYISSSDTKNETFKFIDDDTLKINKLTGETIRSLLILLKDELTSKNNFKKNSQNLKNNLIFLTLKSNNSNIQSNSGILLQKLFHVKKLVINESKTFDYKLLFILLNFIIINFCKNLEEIKFEGTFYSRLDQIDIMLKNGVFLYFILKESNLTKFKLNGKIEFLNENIAYKILYDYCKSSNIIDVNPEKIEFNKINIFSILPQKNSIKILDLSKICIDKISAVHSILEVASKNSKIEEFSVKKFVSIPANYRDKFINNFCNLKNLNKFKIEISCSCKDDLEFLNIPRINSSLKKFSLKLNQLQLEENYYQTNLCIPNRHKNHFDLKHTNLEKISLKFEKINLKETSCLNFITNIWPVPNSLKELSLGMIDSEFFENFTKICPDTISKLNKLKLSFLPTYQENYESSYKNILILLENFRFVKSIRFDNFYIKYNHVLDEEMKKVIETNLNLRELIIKSEISHLTQYYGGFYYYVYPKFTTLTIFFAMKKNSALNKIYYKKAIVSRIFEFQRIKKEKNISISYKV